MTDNTTWQGDAPEPTRNGVLVDGEQVVPLRGGQLRAVALRSGARRWQIDSDSHAIYPVAPGFILATERTGRRSVRHRRLARRSEGSSRRFEVARCSRLEGLVRHVRPGYLATVGFDHLRESP